MTKTNDTAMDDQNQSWVETRRLAEIRPAMFVGARALGVPIAGTLKAVWQLKALSRPSRALLRVSPHQYHLRIEAGPLAGPVQRLIAWEKCDNLDWEIGLAHTRIVRSMAPEAHQYVTSTMSFHDFTAPFILADRSALAIRADAGLWCQTYEGGWPKTPPFLLTDAAPSLGLMVAAALSPHWYPDLPYTREAVERVLPEGAWPHVMLEWHPEDDLLPACPVDPRCILHPENIRSWL
jgi:hypothetical protein